MTVAQAAQEQIKSTLNPFLHTGRCTPDERPFNCEVKGRRGKHTRSWDDRVQWCVEDDNGRRRFTCAGCLGMVLAGCADVRFRSFLSVYAVGDFVRTCEKHGEYMAAMVYGGTTSQCPACEVVQ